MEKIQAEFCVSHGLRLSAVAMPADMRDSPILGKLPERELAGLSIWLQVKKNIFAIDLNPTLPRMPSVDTGEPIFTIVPNAKIIVPGRMQILCGIDCMQLQGFENRLIQKSLKSKMATEPMLRDMAGNAFTVTIPMAITLAIMIVLTEEQIAHYKTLRNDPHAGQHSTSDVLGFLKAW